MLFIDTGSLQWVVVVVMFNPVLKHRAQRKTSGMFPHQTGQHSAEQRGSLSARHIWFQSSDFLLLAVALVICLFLSPKWRKCPSFVITVKISTITYIMSLTLALVTLTVTHRYGIIYTHTPLLP